MADVLPRRRLVRGRPGQRVRALQRLDVQLALPALGLDRRRPPPRPSAHACWTARARSWPASRTSLAPTASTRPGAARWSIASRLWPLCTGHLLGIAPADPGLLRRARPAATCATSTTTACSTRSEHYVRRASTATYPAALEAYVSPGSLYWRWHGLFALSFDPADPFWTAPEQPLPVERGDFELVLPAPGFVVTGRQDTGQVPLLNSRARPGARPAPHNYTSKYGKLAYSTHFPFNVLPAQRQLRARCHAACLTADGRPSATACTPRARRRGPRPHVDALRRRGAGEPQAAVGGRAALGRRAGGRQALVRPTLPVSAYEAPGAARRRRAPPPSPAAPTRPPAGSTPRPTAAPSPSAACWATTRSRPARPSGASSTSTWPTPTPSSRWCGKPNPASRRAPWPASAWSAPRRSTRPLNSRASASPRPAANSPLPAQMARKPASCWATCRTNYCPRSSGTGHQLVDFRYRQ